MKEHKKDNIKKELINKFITYPLAITVFKQDIEKFKQFKLGNIYQDMLESIIERMTKDYYDLKRELISVHHIDVKKITNTKYQVNNEIVEFTSEELKELTRGLMSEYLYGDKAGSFERKDRIWKEE